MLMALFTPGEGGGGGRAGSWFFVVEDALGVPIGVEIDIAKDGILPVGIVVLGARLVGGTADGDAGTAAFGTVLLHDAGIGLMAQLASLSDNFSESFFLITWSRSEQAVRYSFLYLSASASSALTSFNCFLKSIDLRVGLVELIT